MTALNPHDQRQLKDFLTSVAPWAPLEEAQAVAAFLALRDDSGELQLVRARVFLTSAPSERSPIKLNTSRLSAGRFLLSSMKLSLVELVERILEGTFPTPAGSVRFAPSPNGTHSVYRVPFHQDGLGSHQRIEVLDITGGPTHSLLPQPLVDWELKAASTPYDSVNELVNELRLSPLAQNSMSQVDIVAPNFVEVDLSATVSGTNARPGIRKLVGIDRDKCSIGYRVLRGGQVVARGNIPSSDLSWSAMPDAGFEIGTGALNIPTGAVVHGFATYDGAVQHQGWIVDPSSLPNPIRTVYEVFDPKLATLIDFCDRPGARGTDARELESAVSWILSMRGFRVMVLGTNKQTQDGVDLVATTPAGNVLLVECTAGVLKADKISQLARRCELVRERLGESGSSHLQVVPLICTNLKRTQAHGGVVLAEQLGIVVACREDIDEHMRRTLLVPDPEASFREAVEAAVNAMERHS